MTKNDPIRTALEFNACINERDADGLGALMTEDHTFIDSLDQTWTGRAICLENWRLFFETFPDYRNVFEAVTAQDDLVTMVGHSRCSDERLDGPALWTARVHEGRIAEWRVYEDTPVNRTRLDVR